MKICYDHHLSSILQLDIKQENCCKLSLSLLRIVEIWFHNKTAVLSLGGENHVQTKDERRKKVCFNVFRLSVKTL